jgi:hypothetical protein
MLGEPRQTRSWPPTQGTGRRDAIIKEYGARIEIESAPGQDTRFTVISPGQRNFPSATA